MAALLALLLPLLLVVAGDDAWSQGGDDNDLLFATQAPLEMELRADFDSLEPPKEGLGRRWQDAELVVNRDTIPVKLAVRGKFRATKVHCRVPMLWLRFAATDTVGTAFEGQADLPLTTQCQGNSRTSNDVLQEYLAYRIYEALSPHSLKSRLALVSYSDTRKTKVLFTGPAFFVEHFEDFASRIGAGIAEIERFDPRVTPPEIMATHDVFQYMIANTDWSVVYQHNVLLIELDNGDITPVPFDFDWAGLVNARYAYPSEVLKIRSVRTRLYRGLCYDRETYGAVKARFLEMRSSINQIIEELPAIRDRERLSTQTYIDGFYDILTDNEAFVSRIEKKCRSFEEF